MKYLLVLASTLALSSAAVRGQPLPVCAAAPSLYASAFALFPADIAWAAAQTERVNACLTTRN
jgi:hypothetical protein